jgi:SAM-dependent methyltransferase
MRNDNSWIIRLYAWLCQRLYYELAWTYDWVGRVVSAGRMAYWRRRALAYLPAVSPGGRQPRVLEIGFGTGELLIDLACQGHNPYGVELSPTMQGVAHQKLTRRGLHLPRVRSQAQAMPFATGSFTAIVATFPTRYILDEQTLHECARLLAPGSGANEPTGGCLIVVGLWVALRPPALARLIPVFYGEPPHEFMVQVEERLAAAGFECEWAPFHDGVATISVLIGRLAPSRSESAP